MLYQQLGESAADGRSVGLVDQGALEDVDGLASRVGGRDTVQDFAIANAGIGVMRPEIQIHSQESGCTIRTFGGLRRVSLREKRGSSPANLDEVQAIECRSEEQQGDHRTDEEEEVELCSHEKIQIQYRKSKLKSPMSQSQHPMRMPELSATTFCALDFGV
jgi:hypothetical protein